jgi:hypothetical protein
MTHRRGVQVPHNIQSERPPLLRQVARSAIIRVALPLAQSAVGSGRRECLNTCAARFEGIKCTPMTQLYHACQGPVFGPRFAPNFSALRM